MLNFHELWSLGVSGPLRLTSPAHRCRGAIERRGYAPIKLCRPLAQCARRSRWRADRRADAHQVSRESEAMDPWEGTQLPRVKPVPDPLDPGSPGSINVIEDATGDSDVVRGGAPPKRDSPEPAPWPVDAARLLLNGPLRASAMLENLNISVDSQDTATFSAWLASQLEARGYIESGLYRLTEKGFDYFRDRPESR